MSFDQLYGAETAKACGSCLFAGRGWLTSAYFPGASPLPDDAAVVHDVGINATVLRQWGRRAAFDTDTDVARKPTGLYLSPGAMARVRVPQSVVDAGGYTVLVGAHTRSHAQKAVHKRLDRGKRGKKDFYPVQRQGSGHLRRQPARRRGLHRGTVPHRPGRVSSSTSPAA